MYNTIQNNAAAILPTHEQPVQVMQFWRHHHQSDYHRLYQAEADQNMTSLEGLVVDPIVAHQQEQEPPTILHQAAGSPRVVSS